MLWGNCVERAQIEGSGFATANYKFSRGENKTCSRRASLVSEDAESAELQAARVGFEILEYTETSCCYSLSGNLFIFKGNLCVYVQ